MPRAAAAAPTVSCRATAVHYFIEAPIAGSDTFRGCSFQAAYSVELALDVLDGAGAALTLEGSPDVVDAAIESENGNVLRAVQAKTKVEPYAWEPAEIAAVVTKWQAADPPPLARFDFVSDGQLGPAASTRLRPALERAQASGLTAEDRSYLSDLGLDPDAASLRHVSLLTRQPAGRTLLERATLRVIALRERVAPVRHEEARDLVWRLFGQAVFDSGEQAVSSRRVTRESISELLGVPLSAIDDVAPWSEEIEAVYRQRLSERGANPGWTLLDLLPSGRSPVLSFVTAGLAPGQEVRPQPATSLLDEREDAVLHGAAGTGKTTTLNQLVSACLDRALLPLSVRLGTYVAGSLRQLIGRSVERVVGHPIASGAVDELLSRETAVLLLDGAGELIPDQQRALISDLQALRDLHPTSSVLVAAREPGPFIRLGLTPYKLQRLTGSDRQAIAEALVEDPEEVRRDVERRLGDAAEIPLLFTMAVGLRDHEESPGSRPELFAAFVGGLQQRPGGRALSPAARAIAETACCELRRADSYNAEYWWWLDRTAKAREALVGRGALAEDVPAAEDLLEELIEIGLLHRLNEGSELELLHDLFCDWFASEAIRHGLGELDAPLAESLEEVAVFLAEADALSEGQTRAVASNPIAAARVADALPPGEAIDRALADQLWQSLREHLGAGLSEPLTGRLEVTDTKPRWIYLSGEDAHAEADPVATSPLTCLLEAPQRSLSAAVDLWLGAIRLRLVERSTAFPLPPAHTTAEVARRIEQTADARRAEVEALATEVSPSLAARLMGQIGPLGIRGWLMPATTFTGPPRSGLEGFEHHLYYVLTNDSSEVTLINDNSEVPAESREAGGRMIAESYLSDTPAAAGLTAVAKAVAQLCPRFDD